MRRPGKQSKQIQVLVGVFSRRQATVDNFVTSVGLILCSELHLWGVNNADVVHVAIFRLRRRHPVVRLTLRLRRSFVVVVVLVVLVISIRYVTLKVVADVFWYFVVVIVIRSLRYNRIVLWGSFVLRGVGRRQIGRAAAISISTLATVVGIVTVTAVFEHLRKL